jgi:replicative DNA helicase
MPDHAPSEVSVPPQALDAERSVLAAMLLDAEAVGRAVETITSRVFYRTSHQKIYEAIVALYERNEKADLVTLVEEMRKRGDLEAVGGVGALAQLIEQATTTANIDHHIRIVHAKSILRQLIHASSEIQQEAYAASDDTTAILDRAEQRIFAIAGDRVRQGFMPIASLVMGVMEQAHALSERGSAITGVTSGYPDLDRKTSGFQAGDLIIVAGRPSMGKTSLAMNLVENAAMPFYGDREAARCAVFSIEMSMNQLVQRFLCSQSGISLQRLRTGAIHQAADWHKLAEACTRLAKAPIHLDDTGNLTLLEIRAKSRRLKAEGKLDMVVIDYLQLIQPPARVENRVQEVSQISRGLKSLAKELQVPVIALSQLSRAAETRDKSGRPQLSDLRDSGSIEQDADVVMFIYREVVYNKEAPEPDKAELIIAKQRNGPTGSVLLRFDNESTRFRTYSSEELPAASSGVEPEPF